MRRILILIVGAYLLLVLAVFLFGHRLVFFPHARGDWTAPESTESVWFGQPRLHAWYLTYPEAKWTILVFHGNEGNIAGRKPMYQQLRGLGVNVFAVDTQGFGKSEGSPSEEGFYSDAIAAWAYLVEKRGIAPTRIVVLGQSLGSAAATYLAANRECGGLVLEAPMTSVKGMAARVVPFPPLAWALRVEMDNVSRISDVRCPVLVVHGTDDRVIPFDEGQAVFAAASEPKQFLPIQGGDHNDLWDGEAEEYLNAVRAFVQTSDRSKRASTPDGAEAK